MVDLLAPKKKTGFRFDIFPDFEREKAERAEAAGVATVTMGVAVWEPNDPRWHVSAPYRFRPYTLKYGGPCVYCAERIDAGEYALYSRTINSVAHVECHGGYDLPVPEGGIKPSISDHFAAE